MHNADPVVILSYARTPMGAMQGALADVSATDLGATVVKAAVERAGVDGAAIERIYMGCVLPAGLGQAPARQAAIKAGLPKSVQATTVNKVCGSGMQTVIMGSEALAAGSVDYVIAGGMESMTNAPYLLKKHRSGARIGHDTAYDHMFLDGLEDAYEPGRAMGTFGEQCADKYQFTREAQDEYALQSQQRYARAVQAGKIAEEIVPMKTTMLKVDKATGAESHAEVIVDRDECNRPDTTLEGLAKLPPAFEEDGSVTAGNASGINDGAAVVVHVVDRHQRPGFVAEDALQGSIGGCFEGAIHLFNTHAALKFEHRIGEGGIQQWYPHRVTVEFALQLGKDHPDCFGGAGGGWNQAL